MPEIILFKTQEMCDSVIHEDPISIRFLLRYVSDQYKTQKMCNKAVDYSLAALKFFPDSFVISKMIKIIVTAFYTDENILYFYDNSNNVGFTCNGMGNLSVDINNTNLDDMMKMILILLFLSNF